MRVRILKATKGYWYSKHIGEVFEIEDKEEVLGGKRYHVLTIEVHKNVRKIIDVGDFEIVCELIDDMSKVSELFEEKVKKLYEESTHREAGSQAKALGYPGL